MTFVDNHDVTRLASILTNKKHIPLAYGLLMGMPGIPCLYYGSEWAEQGEKERVIVAINAADYPYTANAGELNGTAADLLTGETVTMNGQLELKPYSVQYLKF